MRILLELFSIYGLEIRLLDQNYEVNFLIKIRLGGEVILPRALNRIFKLSCDPFALVARLVEASKSNLLCVQRRKAKTLWLRAFEDI